MEMDILSTKEERAMELVLAGVSDRETAEELGVTRQCVYKWRTMPGPFRSALEERRKALREQHRDEISGLVSEAIGVMREGMREENMATRLRAAQMVLRTAGVQASMQEEQPPTKEAIIEAFISELIEEARIEMGVVQRKRLVDGE